MIKLPRTLHIEGSRFPQDSYYRKADPEAIQFPRLAGEFLVIEEKVDGTGVSLFFDEKLELQIWHRGSPAIGEEFFNLRNWAKRHENELLGLLEDRFILFGEWMLNKHTIFYDQLPHYFLESDVYDKLGTMWLSTPARNSLLIGHNYIKQVSMLAAFQPTSLHQIVSLVGKPLYQSKEWRESMWQQCDMSGLKLDEVLAQTDQSDLAEGLYIKHEDDRHVIDRYKYVRYQFVETIVNSGSHIRDRVPMHNVALGGYGCLL